MKVFKFGRFKYLSKTMIGVNEKQKITNEIYEIQDSNELINFAGQVGHKIPYGHNEYTFSFRLPNNIPCSFEHTNGYIRYTVKAVIDRPWKFDHECKAAFTVVSNLDLNLYREKCVRN